MQTPLSSAVHEASHIVVVLALGGIARGVDIETIDGRGGLARYVYPEKTLVEKIAICAAGTIGEWELGRRRGQKVTGGASGDYANIEMALDEALGTNRPHRDKCREYREGELLARSIICRHWGAVKRIAERLVAYTEVSGALCTAIFLSHRHQERERASN
jgi:hypothetical protein